MRPVNRSRVVGAALLFLALLTALHQYVNWGVLFELEDVLHHETLVVVLLALGAVLLLAGVCRSEPTRKIEVE